MNDFVNQEFVHLQYVLNLRGFQTASSPIGLTDSVRQSTIANFLVIGGFAAFAFVVQYVLQTIAAAND